MYTSVSKPMLQQAFALAHKLSEAADVPLAQRNQFRAIAHLLWNAHGEAGRIPAGAGAKLIEQAALAAKVDIR